MCTFNEKEQLFFYKDNNKNFKRNSLKNVILQDCSGVSVVNDGIILPIRTSEIDKKTNTSIFEGGVCDSNLNFIAGHSRRKKALKKLNYTCEKSYIPEIPVTHKNEKVIFGGILINHYGHMLAECLGRLWWFIDNPDTHYKIIFVNSPLNGEFQFQEILEAAGITKDKFEIIDTPTSYNEIIIPEESIYYSEGYSLDYQKIFDKIVENLPYSPHKKIYFSRSKFEKNDGVNEEYFENFYRKRGYHIVYPEQLSFIEKASLVYGASEFASVVQSGIYTLFCAKNGLNATFLVRSSNLHLAHWFPLTMRNINYSFIDANFNFLSSSHAGHHVYLYGPTYSWVRYLDKKKISYDKDEISLDFNLKPYIYTYICQWAENYSIPSNYKKIRNTDLISILSNIQVMFNNKGIERNSYLDPDKITNFKKELLAEKELSKTLYVEKNLLSNIVKDSILKEKSSNLMLMDEPVSKYHTKQYKQLSLENKKLKKKIFKVTEQKESFKNDYITVNKELNMIKNSDFYLYVQRVKQFCNSNIFGSFIKKCFKFYMKKVRNKDKNE